ncbi:MAG: TonB-dependent receptor [Microscillaceae bacterium]|nr:TonB-dependent receptor [Microscillaceae bacterium]
MRSLIILWVFYFCFGTQISAQNTATLKGFVKDAKTGEPLIGATVILESTSLGTSTDAEGYFTLENVEAKSYNITASYIGYENQTKFNVIVRSGANPDINFEMNEQAGAIDEIVIQANPFEKLEETPLSIQKLSREEIATYPGGNNDIAKVVQSLPGVSASVGGFRNDVIIRGGAPNENVYYLDGVEIPNINHFSTQGSAGGPVGLLNVSFFEGVTLSTASFAARYDNVLSGVLQFDQRKGNAEAYNTNIRISASEAALTLEGPLFKKKDIERAKTTFIASVRRSYLQLLFQLLELPFLPDYWDYQFKLNHQIDAYNEINLIGLGSIDNFEINAEDDLTAEEQANLDQVPIIKQWTTTWGISWKRRFKNGKGAMQTTLSTNAFNNEFSRFNDNRNQTGLFFNNKSLEWESKLRYELTNFFGDWTLNSGFVVQNARYTNRTEDLINNINFDVASNFQRYGIFSQISRPFIQERLQASFGLRLDGNTFTDTGHEIWRTFSPRLALSYQLDPKGQWRINASVGRYFKIPPYTILGFQDNSGNFLNTDAKYIRSDQAVLGVEYLPRSSTRFTVEGFYKRYADYPVSLKDGVSLGNLGGDFSVLGNEEVLSIGLGRSYGVEFLFQQQLQKNLYAILAYTLYWSEYTGLDKDAYLPSTWDNRHLLTFTGGYKLPRNWEISLRMRLIGKAPFAPVNEEATQEVYPDFVFEYERLGEQRLDVFNQTDIRIDKKWNFKGWTFNVFFEIENLFASQIPSPPVYGLNRDADGNVIEPRELIRINDLSNSTILPTLGIVVDF